MTQSVSDLSLNNVNNLILSLKSGAPKLQEEWEPKILEAIRALNDLQDSHRDLKRFVEVCNTSSILLETIGLIFDHTLVDKCRAALSSTFQHRPYHYESRAELLENICKFLDIRTLLNLRATSRFFKIFLDTNPIVSHRIKIAYSQKILDKLEIQSIAEKHRISVFVTTAHQVYLLSQHRDVITAIDNLIITRSGEGEIYPLLDQITGESQLRGLFIKELGSSEHFQEIKPFTRILTAYPHRIYLGYPTDLILNLETNDFLSMTVEEIPEPSLLSLLLGFSSSLERVRQFSETIKDKNTTEEKALKEFDELPPFEKNQILKSVGRMLFFDPATCVIDYEKTLKFLRGHITHSTVRSACDIRIGDLQALENLPSPFNIAQLVISKTTENINP